MLVVKFILGFTLLVLASINHLIIYSTRCHVGDLLHYLSLRSVKVYIALCLFALIFQLILVFGNLFGGIDFCTRRLLGFLPLVCVLLFMNIGLLLKLPNMSQECTSKLNLKADTFYVLASLVTLCLFFDRIGFIKPCPVMTSVMVLLIAITVVSGLFLIRYMKLAYILVDRMDVDAFVKLLIFTSMVFGFQSMASFCYPEIASWLALLGVSSLLLSAVVVICTVRRLAVV